MLPGLFKWIPELDEYQEDPSLDDDINNTDEEAKIDYEELYKQQLAKIQEMELQLKEIKKPQIRT